MGKTPKKKKKTVKSKKKVSASKTKKKPATAPRKKRSRRPLEEIVAEQLAPAQEELDQLIPSAERGDTGPQASYMDFDDSASDIDDFTDVSQERSSIISIVRGFEEQVETAFALKNVLEGELDATQQRLAREVEARSELEAQLELLQTRAALAEHLREDISFIEQERNEFADELATTKLQLEKAVAECDSFAEQVAAAEADVKELKGDKMALEAQIMNLKDKIVDNDSLYKELAETSQAYQHLREQHHDQTRRMDASKDVQEALERELAGTRQNMQAWRAESEALRGKVANAQSRLSDLNIQLKDQQGANRELMGTNARLENESVTARTEYEAARKELNALKMALRDIRSEAKQTSGRVRQKYSKPNYPSRSNPGSGHSEVRK
jgi:chromosome segregation ATPase